jgi:hypothetical protein
MSFKQSSFSKGQGHLNYAPSRKVFFFVCLTVSLYPHKQFFSCLVTTTGDMAANLNLCFALMAFGCEGSFTYHICCDTEPPYLRSYSRDQWVTSKCRALDGGAITYQFQLFRFDAVGISAAQNHYLPDAKRERYQYATAAAFQQFLNMHWSYSMHTYNRLIDFRQSSLRVIFKVKVTQNLHLLYEKTMLFQEYLKSYWSLRPRSLKVKVNHSIHYD